jgi:dienelactone hydrolase/8-oxo-dGTP pyrophosphatase MutT (NUDIX family)
VGRREFILVLIFNNKEGNIIAFHNYIMQKKISFKNTKGQRLVGILHIPKGKGSFPAVIVQHGFRSNHRHHLIKAIARSLEREGFVVLRFSLSGHWPSGGSYKDVLVSQFVKDIRSAIKFLLKESKVNRFRLGMVGHSLGAFTTLICANKLSKYFRSIVSIASFYDTYAIIKSYQRDKKIEAIGRDYWIISGFKVTNKHYLDRHYLKKKYLLSDIHCPALIIHGSGDKRARPKDAYLINKLLNQPKALKIIKGADHNFYNRKHIRIVVNSTVKWLKKYLAFKVFPVVNVLLEHQGKILLLKRSQKVGTYRGLWLSVAGYLERGDNVLNQARKEVKEETGIKLGRLKGYQMAKSFKFIDKKIDRIWQIHPVLIKLKRKPKIRLDWESVAYRWVKPADIHNYQVVPSLLEVIKRVGFKI